MWKENIKYQGVQLDWRLSFGEQLQIATTKAIQCDADLAWLIPNIDGPREAKSRLVASVVHSKLLYAAPVWASALNNHATERCDAENSLSIPNCINECCAGPGDRPANRPIGEGKVGDFSVLQGTHLYDQATGNCSRERSHL